MWIPYKPISYKKACTGVRLIIIRESGLLLTSFLGTAYTWILTWIFAFVSKFQIFWGSRTRITMHGAICSRETPLLILAVKFHKCGDILYTSSVARVSDLAILGWFPSIKCWLDIHNLSTWTASKSELVFTGTSWKKHNRCEDFRS